MPNPRKPIKVWNLDGTLADSFPSQTEAAIALHSSRPNISLAARHKRVIAGKYRVSCEDIFPAVPFVPHKNSKPVWAWDINLNLLGEYTSQERAGKAHGVTSQSVRHSMKKGHAVDGKYIFTVSPAPPALKPYLLKRIEKSKPKPTLPCEKYGLIEFKWVSLGEHKEMEDAAKASGLSPRTIRRMIANGCIHHKIFRARMRGRKIFIEKREWVESGKFKTLTEIANKIKVSPAAASRTSKIGGIISDKYKILRNPQPNQTADV